MCLHISLTSAEINTKNYGSMANKRECLRVAIFPYIPDLRGDSLQSLVEMTKREFEKLHPEIDLEVIGDPKLLQVYNMDYLEKECFTDSENAFDIMEVDTVLLRELVDRKCLQPLDPDQFKVNTDRLFDAGVTSVQYKDRCYGVPTLQCASFLMELACHKPLLHPNSTYDELHQSLSTRTEPKPHSKSERHILLAGDFRGSWTLPMFYLTAYVDRHGQESLGKSVDAPVEETDLPEMEWLMGLGERSDGSNPDVDGTFHDKQSEMIAEVVQSEHILMYGYSEMLGDAKKCAGVVSKELIPLSIISMPLEHGNFLMTYTDALVVNRYKFPSKAAAIEKFVKFYTSAQFRARISLGDDLPTSYPPRYLIPACREFFLHAKVASDRVYQMIHDCLKHSVPAPNHDIYTQRKKIGSALMQMLNLDKTKPSKKVTTSLKIN